MPRRKDPEITSYKLKNGQTYFRLKTYIGIDPETGKSIKVTRSKLKSRKEAEQVRNQLKAKGANAVAHNMQINATEKSKTVDDVFKIWISVISADVRPATVGRHKSTYRTQIQPEFGNNYISAISPDHIQQFANELADKYTTYKSIINLLHRLISYAIFRGWCDKDPFAKVLIPKKSKRQSRDNSKNFYEQDELKRFLATAKDYDPMVYVFFHTIASLGCRRGEALAFKWSDFDFDHQTVSIVRTVAKNEDNKKAIDDVKNGIHHVVPMSARLKSVLLEYRQYCKDNGRLFKYVFPTSTGTYWYPQQPDQWMKRMYKFDDKRVAQWNATHPKSEQKKPMRRITPHGLRHTLATLLYDGDSNIKPQDVQFVLGHKTPKTALDIYTHVTQKQRKNVSKSINNLDL